MRGSKISLLGLYTANPDLFDDFTIPTQLTASVLIDNLLMETADMEVLYPDADFMQQAIKSWSLMHIHEWQKQADTLYEDYDPFINLKRDEYRTITETRDLASGETRDLASGETRDLADGNTQTTNVNAWDDSSATGVTRNIVTDSGTNTGTVDYTDTGTVDKTDTGTITTTDEYHMTGDSAIKDAQDVARAEINLRNDLIMYQIIIKDFMKKFILLVY